MAGVVPFMAIGFVRSAYARDWALKETTKVLHDQGIVASFDVLLHLWPLSIELANVQVQSSDGGDPVLTARRATVHPRFFALMSGKLMIDQIDIDAPHARIALRDGKLMNLALKPSKDTAKSSGPLHLPFDALAMTDGDVDLAIDDVRIQAHGLDLDVATTDDDPTRGTSLEVALRAAESYVINHRTAPDGTKAYDEDAVCTLDARVRITPEDVTVRRFEMTGAADLDPGKLTTPPCSIPDTDQRHVLLELSHAHMKLPKGGAPPNDFSGHVKVRVPVGLGTRIAQLPDVEGWVGVDADIRYAPGLLMPEVSGRVTAGASAVAQYRFADAVDADITLRDNVIKSPRTMVQLAGGTVHLKDVHVEPLAKTLGAAADIDSVDFAELMRALGVADHPHVTWDVVDIHMPVFGGTLDPLKLDGDFTATTRNFAVYDKWIKDPVRQRTSSGSRRPSSGRTSPCVPTRCSSRAPTPTFAHSHVEGGFVSLGFHNDLRVDVGRAKVDLVDITPLASVPIAGQADVTVNVGTSMLDPKVTGEGSVNGFSIADLSLGNITAVHADVERSGDMQILTLKNVKATKNKSLYDMPAGKVEFGGEASMKMEAAVHAERLNLRDLLDVFHMNDDPRFEGIDGDLAGDTTMHVALGGVEDECGGGMVSLHASPHLSAVNLFGEKFDDGDADLDLRWRDRAAGFAGADVDVHAFTLHKVRREKDGATFGSLLGSATIRPGGILHGNVVLEGVPLSRLQTLGSIAPELEGTVSGLAEVSGTLDAFTANADVDVSPIHVRSADLGASQLHLTMTQLPSKTTTLGKTRCGGDIPGPFDKDALREGRLVARGVRRVRRPLRRPDPLGQGHGHPRQADGGLRRRPDPEARRRDGGQGRRHDRRLHGQAEGRGLGRRDPRPRQAGRPRVGLDQGGASLARPRRRRQEALAQADRRGHRARRSNAVHIPPFELGLSTVTGVSGAITVQGDVRDPFGDPTLDVRADLAPVDLSVLAGVVPKLDRATGSFAGAVHMTGRAADPQVSGDAKVRASELVVRGLPAPVNDLEIDVRADASEMRITHGSAKLAGGLLTLGGRVPIRNLGLGNVELTLGARNVRFAPADGITAGVDADLQLTIDDAGEGKRKLPHLTGEIAIASLDYTRPINLAGDLGSLGTARRTDIETYDPTQDSVSLDVRVRARTPIRIKNNLVETQIQLDNALVVSGTNQRFGLRGEMHAVPGGRLRLKLPFGTSVFDIQQGIIRFDDATRIAAHVDLLATTEYRRTSGQSSSTTSSSSTTGTTWRITLHASGDSDNLKIELTSDPPLSQEDIVLLLTIGITRAEADQIQAGTLGQSVALEALSALSGASTAVKSAIPVIDDFKFGSAYSPKSGRSEPTVTVGKRLTKDISANVATSLSEDRELRANVMWRLGQNFSVQGSYDNVNNDVTSSAVGNLGVDLRWRVEFQ